MSTTTSPTFLKIYDQHINPFDLYIFIDMSSVHNNVIDLSLVFRTPSYIHRSSIQIEIQPVLPFHLALYQCLARLTISAYVWLNTLTNSSLSLFMKYLFRSMAEKND